MPTSVTTFAARLVPHGTDDHPDAAETLAAAQDAVAVRQAVVALPEIFREVVVFRYFEDLTVPEIAQVLGIPEGSVKSRLNRAKQRGAPPTFPPRLAADYGMPPSWHRRRQGTPALQWKVE